MLHSPTVVFGMHIAEGFLPVRWVVIWFMVFLPFLVIGFRKVKKLTSDNASYKLLFAVVGAFVFVLSSLKLPSVAGSSSHLTGIALGAILFGASSMSVIGLIVLLFQALLLAHGGLTTLGANAFSMSVVGAYVAIWVFNLGKAAKAPMWLAVFMAAFLSDLMIYVCTSGQLALAFQTEVSTFVDNLIKFLSVFAVTQLPLAVAEGIFTVFAFRLILKYNRAEVQTLNPSLIQLSRD
jgi:cobalt/nickel transport system permease protein